MRTISQPVAKNRIFCVRDMPRLGLGSGTAEPFGLICGSEACGGMGMEFLDYSRSHVLNIRVEHAFLLEVVGHGVLRQKRRLEANFGPDPLAFGVRSVGRVVAAAAATELWTEVRTLNLIKLADLAPCGGADGSGDL